MKNNFTMNNTLNIKRGLNLIKSWLKPSYVLLSIFLTLGVGQLWAADASSANIYYDNSSSNWSNVQLLIGHNTYSEVYALTKLTNSNQLYYKRNFSWGGYSEFYFVTGCSSWGSEGNSPTNRTGYCTNSAKLTTNVGSGTYLFVSSGGSDGSSVTANSLSGYDALNYTQTVQRELTTNGGTSYSATTTDVGTVKVSSYKLASASATSATSDAGTIGSGQSSATCKAVRTATITVDVTAVNTGYHFVGWYVGDTRVSTNQQYGDYWATEGFTFKARFTQNFPAGSTIYLLPNSTWKSGTCNRYAAYFYGSGGSTWVNCSRVGTSDYYSVTVPAGNWGYVILCAMTSNATNDWANKVYQTDDLMYDSSHNGVEITGSNNSQSRITVYNDISVSHTPTVAASAPTITNSQTVVKLGNSVTINAQTANTGYQWVNWTKTSGTLGNANNRTTTFTPSANNATATANYSAINYTITYNNMTGATNHASNPSTYTIESSAITLQTPTKDGYIFGGWYSDSGLSTPVSTIPAGSTGNKTFYAKWTAITVSATLTPTTGVAGATQDFTFSITSNVSTSDGYYVAVYNFGTVGSGTHGAGYMDGDKAYNTSPVSYSKSGVGGFASAGIYTTNVVLLKNSVVIATSDAITFAAGNYYTVSFDLQGHGSSISPQNILSGSTATEPSPAPTADGYTFGGWYQEPACTNAWNFSTAITAARTLYAKWTAKTYTVTLNRESGTTGSTSVTATYNSGMPSATMPTRTGYTFDGYYASANGVGTKYYNADGSSAHIWDIAGTGTLHANWTENMTSVTLAASPAGAGTFTIGGSPVSSTTAGVTTTRSVTAVPGDGYYINTSSTVWTKDNNNITLSSTTAASTTVTGCGTSATSSTLTATFTPVWYLKGGFNSWGDNLPFVFTNATSGYVDVNLSANSTFKIYKADEDDWYGTQYGIEKGVRLTTEFWTDNENECPITINSIEGTYRFTLDISGTYPQVTVTPPTVNQIRFYSARSDGDLTNTYDFENTGSSTWTKTINLTKGTHWFKVIEDAAYLGNDGTMTRDNCSNWTMTAANNCGITADVTGNYLFSYVPSTDKLSVTYPEAYTVTYGVGTGFSSMGGVSISPAITSGNYVLSGTSVTFTATPNIGYKFVGWYTTVACSGDPVSTSATYNIASLGANTTLYAKFAYRDLYIHADWISWGTAQMTQSTSNRAIYTYTYENMGALASALDGGNWNIGYHFRIMNADNGGDGYLAYNYNGVQTPTYSGSVDAVHLTSAGNPTIEFGLTKESKVTITLTLQSVDDATKPTISIAADPYYTITYGVPVHGSYTIKVGDAGAVSATTKALATQTITLAPSPATGYHFDSWIVTKAGGGTVTVTSNQFAMPSDDVTIAATFLPTSYDVTLKANGGEGADKVVTATYDAAMPSTLKGGGELTAHSRTGYYFAGYYDDESAGTQYYDNAVLSVRPWDKASTANLFAHWTAKSYTITLNGDEEHKATAGTYAVTGGEATFDAALPALSGTLPTAENGYAFMGFYSEQNGNGVQVIDASGAWVATATGYTSSGNWVHAGNATLYAYFKKAVITGFTFSPSSTVAPSATLSVTANIEPTPVGNTVVCWRVLHNNDNPLETQPTFSPASGATVSFTVPATSGTYKIEATLSTGTTCDAGTELSQQKVLFQVAGDHEVTVQYQCGGTTIKASETVTGKPLEWSGAIAAPDIFGYTFHHWKAGDGITLSEDGVNAKTGAHADSSVVSSIYIKAIYDGRLTAVYTQNNIIYFKNTLGWSSVFVNFYDNDYWGYNDASEKGSGNKDIPNRNKTMTRIGETDVWYYDYGAAGITPSSHYVSFTEHTQTNAQWFWGSGDGENVVYPARRADDLADKAGAIGFYAKTPMFVPLAGQTAIVKNNEGGGKANYYNNGYWTKYTAGTGYTLEIYYNYDESPTIKSIPFNSADELMPMTAVADLEANTTYRFQLKRDGDVYYGNAGDMSYANHGQSTAWEMSNEATRRNDANDADVFGMCRIATTASGDYTFHLSYSGNSSEPPQYRLRIAVDYPIANGDYRVIYTDGTRSSYKPSAIIPKVNDGKDTVSFFIRPANSPEMKIQQADVNASTGAITWSAGTDITSELTAVRCPKDSVYNICLTMNGSGAISVENVEAYTGNYYIRTDCANSKWDNYRSDPEHRMTYSEYSEQNSDYTHYFMVHTYGANVKFVIANDYSPCISDTLIQSTYKGISDAAYVNEYGDLSVEANIRFMWHRHTNEVKRAYLSPAKSDGSHYLVLRGQATKLLSEGGEALSSGNNYGVENNSIQFSDDENWIYETTVQSVPSSYVKLYARYQGSDIYYKGDSGDDNFNNSDDDSDGIPNAIQLITGSSETPLKVRVIYDFKTDRLVAAYLPGGSITEDMKINADVMFIREHQGDISQVTFSEEGKISKIKTAYAVMQFNKWTLNNKSKTGSHEPLASPLSRYERDLFYVSFPFRVNLNEVFGFGTYGVHWIMEEYDGAGRAAKGFWQDSPTFWKFITNRQGKYLEPNTGYLLALDLDELGESSSVWAHDVEKVELFFPSTGSMDDITSSSRTYELPEHTCTIVRNGSDRRIADSHWNIMSVPTYVNTNNVEFANTLWSTGDKDPDAGKLGPNFLYTWNPDDNSLTATTARGFTYHAMHAYTVQYCGNVKWTSSVSVTPSPIVARQQTAPTEYEWCLELQQNETMLDRTYVRMSNEEEVTTGFEFGYDMSKDLNKNKANIYSFITTAESTEMVAGNSMPMETEQTTLVPLGVVITTTGDYTFAMPDGTNGVGVTLVDNVTNERTSLSALDYTVNLTAGDYTNRFWLEISPVPEVPTDIPSTGAGIEGKAQKKLIDGILYIVRDGKMYDARGAKVK